jgi:ribosomal protein S27AE
MDNQSKKMICPKCGAEMNQHAQKVMDPRNRDDIPRMDPSMGGVLYEMHACPACGANASRAA